MITVTENKDTNYAKGPGKKTFVEVYCLSTDEKPIDGIMNGSACIEMDTGKIYFFDELAKIWRMIGSN